MGIKWGAIQRIIICQDLAMVVFRQKLDSSGKIYIRKVLREIGLDDEVEIAPNSKAAVIYSTNVPLSQVLDSLRVISEDLRLRRKFSKEKVV